MSKLAPFNNSNLSSSPFTMIIDEWFDLIVDDNGCPDHFCIHLVGKLFSFFKNPPSKPDFYNGPELPFMKEGRLVINYEYLTNKFRCSNEKIRRRLVKLEKLNLLDRETCNVMLSNGQRVNRVYISFKQKFLDSCFRNSETDIRASESRGKSCNISPNLESAPQICGDHIKETRNNNKNRSMRSNFVFDNSGKKSLNLKNKQTENQKEKPNNFLKKAKGLKEFYPLSDKDTEELQILSGREFSKRAMNEILLSMASKLPDREFFSRKGFMSYMSKAFSYEKRQAPMVNNENFRIKSNYTEEEISSKEREKFLSDLEYNLETSPEMHFKKKLASVLKPESAYNLLKVHISTRIEEEELVLNLSKIIEIKPGDQELILNQANAVYSRLEQGEFKQIKTIRLETTRKNFFEKLSERVGISSMPDSTNPCAESKIPEGIWGDIRKKLIKELGEQGRAIDKSWFSKLDGKLDEKGKILKLQAPSEFFKDYIDRNYLEKIKRYAKSQAYGVGDVMLC